MTGCFVAGSKGRLGLPLANWMPGVTYFVEPQEEMAYRESHPEERFAVLGENDKGFGYLLNQMLSATEDRGAGWMVFLDDDLLGLLQREVIGAPWERCRGEKARLAVLALEEVAENAGLAQLAVSFKGHSWGARKPYVEPTGAWGLHLTRVSAARGVGGWDENLAIFNDWDFSAKLLLSGRRCARTNLLTFEHRMRSQPGGAEAIYARQDRVREAIRVLQGRYPGICREKWVEAHGQAEIRFDWKRAALPGTMPGEGSRSRSP